MGELGNQQIADKFGVAVQTVSSYKDRKKDKIQAVFKHWEDEFASLWSVQKHNRVAILEWMLDAFCERVVELQTDAETATETMRSVHPEASKVRVPIGELKACNREIVRLVEVIAKEMGQDVAYAGAAYDGLGVASRLQRLGILRDAKPTAEGRRLRGEPEPEQDEVSELQGRDAEIRRQQALQRLRNRVNEYESNQWEREWLFEVRSTMAVYGLSEGDAERFVSIQRTMKEQGLSAAEARALHDAERLELTPEEAARDEAERRAYVAEVLGEFPEPPPYLPAKEDLLAKPGG
jgi:hypothetical protein